jgi:hypothetical protein
MTILHKSRRLSHIDKLGYQPKRPGSNPTGLNRCPIIGDPLKWLERSNDELKGKEK